METRERKDSKVGKSAETKETRGFSHWWHSIFDLRKGLDRKKTITNIEDNIPMHGDNTWLLIASIFIASIGLDVASPAVIIGAMLISPLMSPILGVGLAVGINHRKMLKESLINMVVAIVVTLIVSSLYFLLTPFGDYTPEMASRTRPTLLDVGVAFFGGIAGIVASSRKSSLNAVPGVAIATALLPPLCVAGYGLSQLNWGVFWGAFYLFFLNSVFVALATYLVVRFLRFPYSDFVKKEEKRKTQALMLVFIVLTMAPSGWILYTLLEELNHKRKIESFVHQNFNTELRQAIKWEEIEGKPTDVLKVYLIGQYLPEDSLSHYQSLLTATVQSGQQLHLVQMETPPSFYNELAEDIQLDMMKQLEVERSLLAAKDSQITALRHQLSVKKTDSLRFIQLNSMLTALYPELKKAHFSSFHLDTSTNEMIEQPQLYLDWNENVDSLTRSKASERIRGFVIRQWKLTDLELREL